MAVSLSIVSEFAGKGVATAIQQFKQLDSTTAKASFAFKKLLIPGAIAAAGAIVGFTKVVMPAVNAASDLEESLAKNEVIFGKASQAVERFANEAARAFGQSKTQALAAASTFGTFGKAAGLAGQELAAFSTDFVALASDLASFNNTTPEEAINAIGAALRGEAEPMRRFGVLLNDATLKAAAFEMGIYSGNGALTAQQKVLAAQRVIYQQTTDAQGDFARTSDGLANQQRILAAQVDDLQAKFGQLLLPVFQKVVKYINDNILPAVTAMIDGFEQDGLSGAIEYFAASFGRSSIAVIENIKNISIAVVEMGGHARKAAAFIALSLAPVIGFQKAWGLYNDLSSKSAEASDNISAAFDRMIDRVSTATQRLEELRRQMAVSNPDYIQAKQNVWDLANNLKTAGTNAEETTEKAKKFGGGISEAEQKAKALQDRTKKLSDALKDEMGAALDDAQDRLKEAQSAFNGFADSVTKVAEEALNFGDAFKKSAEEGGKSFFDELQDQANRAQEFGTLVERLLTAGISKEALDQVLAAGVESGTEIAKQLLNSADGVLRANTLVQQTEQIAARIGQLAAAKFYQAGVDNGKAYLRGVEEAIAATNARLGRARTPADVKGAGALFGASMGTVGTNAGVVNNYNITTETLDPQASAKAVVDALIEANRFYGPLDIAIAV